MHGFAGGFGNSAISPEVQGIHRHFGRQIGPGKACGGAANQRHPGRPSVRALRPVPSMRESARLWPSFVEVTLDRRSHVASGHRLRDAQVVFRRIVASDRVARSTFRSRQIWSRHHGWWCVGGDKAFDAALLGCARKDFCALFMEVCSTSGGRPRKLAQSAPSARPIFPPALRLGQSPAFSTDSALQVILCVVQSFAALRVQARQGRFQLGAISLKAAGP